MMNQDIDHPFPVFDPTTGGNLVTQYDDIGRLSQAIDHIQQILGNEKHT